MSAISEQLEEIVQIKSDIKAAIIEQGQSVGDDFSTYATAIGNIEGGGGSNFSDSHIEFMADSTREIYEYTFTEGGTYLAICAYPHSGTGSITFNNATIISDVTLPLTECAVLCKIAEVEANDTVTLNCTWNTMWPGRTVAIFKLDGFTIDTAAEVVHIGTKDGTTTYTLPNDNNNYLVYGLGQGAAQRDDTTSNKSLESLTGAYSYNSKSRIVICKGKDSPNFSFYGYDGGYSAIMAWKIIPN